MDKMSVAEPPYQHQLDSVAAADVLHDYALLYKPGAGKTRPAIRIAVNKYKAASRNMRTLIFTPPVVVPQFRQEWFKYTNVKPDKIKELTGPGPKRIRDFLEACAAGSFIFITNYESLNISGLFEEFKAWAPELLIFDESHNLKSTTAKRSKLADELANPYDIKTKLPLTRPHVYLLSGTPVLASPMDIFQQFKIMDPNIFGANFFAFRGRYFRDRNSNMPAHIRFPKWEIMNLEKDGFDAMADLQATIQKHAMYADVDKYLPGETFIPYKVSMTKDQARAYKEMRDDLVTSVATGTAVANLAIVKALRLMQIASGFISVESNNPELEQSLVKHRFPDTPKMEALRELLEQITSNQKKVLVWATWRDNYEQIKQVCNDLKIKYVEVHGGIPERLKKSNIEEFKNNPECSVYIGHPKSGGVGLNLVAATYSIFYSRTFSLEHYEQAKRRNFRGGQTEKVIHYNLVCEGTIDEMAVQALVDKQDMSDRLIKDMVARGL